MPVLSTTPVTDLLFPVAVKSIGYIWRDQEGSRILEKFLRMMGISTVYNAKLSKEVLVSPEDYVIVDNKMISEYTETIARYTKILYIGEDFGPEVRVMGELNKFLSRERIREKMRAEKPYAEKPQITVTEQLQDLCAGGRQCLDSSD